MQVSYFIIQLEMFNKSSVYVYDYKCIHLHLFTKRVKHITHMKIYVYSHNNYAQNNDNDDDDVNNICNVY